MYEVGSDKQVTHVTQVPAVTPGKELAVITGPENNPEPSGITRRRLLIGIAGAVAGVAVGTAIGIEISDGPTPSTRADSGLSNEMTERLGRLRSGDRPEFVSVEEVVSGYKPFGERITEVEPLGSDLADYIESGRNRFKIHETDTDALPDSIEIDGQDISVIRYERPDIIADLRDKFAALLAVAEVDSLAGGYIGGLILDNTMFDPTILAPQMYAHKHSRSDLLARTPLSQSLAQEQSDYKGGKGGGIDDVHEAAQILRALKARHDNPADAFKFSDNIILNFFLVDFRVSKGSLETARNAIAEARSEVLDSYKHNYAHHSFKAPLDYMTYMLDNTEAVAVDYLQQLLKRDGSETDSWKEAAGFYDFMSGVIVYLCQPPNLSNEGYSKGSRTEYIKNVFRHEANHAFGGKVTRRIKGRQFLVTKAGMASNADRHGDNQTYRSVGSGMEEQVTEYSQQREKVFAHELELDDARTVETISGVYNIGLLDALVMDTGTGNGTRSSKNSSDKISSFGVTLIDPDLFERYKLAIRRRVGSRTDGRPEFEYQQTRRELVRAVDGIYGRGFYNRLNMFMDKARYSQVDLQKVSGLIDAIQQDRQAQAVRPIVGQGVIKLPGRKPVQSKPSNLGTNIYAKTNNYINTYLAEEVGRQ